MKKFQILLTLFVFSFSFVSCSSDDPAGPMGTAKVTVELTDAPGDYEAVFVDVEGVMIKTSAEGGEEEGWVSLAGVNTGAYDLLTLTGGMTELLVETEIEAGHLHQIRLVLGDNNYAVIENEVGVEEEHRLNLQTPSAQESGLKLLVDKELKAGAEYTFILDFDVDESVVATGSGSYILKPVIRVSVKENSGSVTGLVVSSAESVKVTAQSSNAEVNAYTNSEGKYELHGLPEGTYLITAIPEDGLGLAVGQVNNIRVGQGASVVLDPIILEDQE